MRRSDVASGVPRRISLTRALADVRELDGRKVVYIAPFVPALRRRGERVPESLSSTTERRRPKVASRDERRDLAVADRCVFCCRGGARRLDAELCVASTARDSLR